jgi:HK97 family phage portal protein
MLPLVIYRRTSDGKERAPMHPLYTLLHDQPNRWQTSFEWREMMAGHLALRGNAYSEQISTGGRGISELIPLHPDRVRPFWAPDKRVAYEYVPEEGPSRVILQDEMLHIRGLGFDGLRGMNPIECQRETIGMTMAVNEHGARMFSNGTRLSGVLEHPHRLGEESARRLKDSWQAAYAGTGNSGKTAVLEEGMKWHSVALSNEDAQYLETRKFQIADIARMFRIPPHLIADLDRSTNNNIEHQGMEFVVHSMGPWFKRFEQAIQRDLITQKNTYFAEFLVDALLRGDSDARSNLYKSGILDGWMTRNEVRAKENMNPLEGLDEPLVPLNMATPGQEEVVNED